MTRFATSLALDRAEVDGLLAALSLSATDLSPFKHIPELTAPRTPRTADEILEEPRESWEDEIIRERMDAVARPDRFVETRLEVFGTIPDVGRLLSSRPVGDEFTVMRAHEEHDTEFLFPFSGDEVLQWAHLQLQYSAGQKLIVPQPMVLDLVELTALLAVVDAWKTEYGRSFVDRDPTLPDVMTLTEDKILAALAKGRESDDRRFAVTVVDDFLSTIHRPGGLDGFSLPDLDRAALARGLEMWIEMGELLPLETDEGQVLELQAGFCQIASSFYTWLNLLAVHDVQVVSGGRGDAQAQEDIAMFFSTPVTVWALVSEGLTGWAPDAGLDSGPKFELRTCTVPESVEILDAFLQLVERVEIRPDLYEADPPPAPAAAPTPTPAPPAPPATPAPAAPAAKFCRQCGKPLADGARFCAGCGGIVETAAPAPSPTPAAPTACPKCGAGLVPGKKFCFSCGGPI